MRERLFHSTINFYTTLFLYFCYSSSVTFTQTMPKILSNVRKKSWELYLERKGYIKCLIQNCQFITDEISVMKDHYYQCSVSINLFR